MADSNRSVHWGSDARTPWKEGSGGEVGEGAVPVRGTCFAYTQVGPPVRKAKEILPVLQSEQGPACFALWR